MSAMLLDLDGEGSASIETTDGNFVSLHSSRAFPPGSTLRGVLQGEGLRYEVKVRGSKRTDTDSEHPFRVDGRFINLSREHRARGTAAD